MCRFDKLRATTLLPCYFGLYDLSAYMSYVMRFFITLQDFDPRKKFFNQLKTCSIWRIKIMMREVGSATERHQIKINDVLLETLLSVLFLIYHYNFTLLQLWVDLGDLIFLHLIRENPRTVFHFSFNLCTWILTCLENDEIGK